jgi:hypothetical protein
MLSLLIDQDFNHDILRGLLRRLPDLDSVTAYEVGLSEAADPELLVWAARETRILITHDRTTMPNHAAELIAKDQAIAGVIIVPRRLSIRQVINDLEIIVTCSEVHEWSNIIRYLPL